MMLTSLYILKNIHTIATSRVFPIELGKHALFFFEAREVAIEYNIYLGIHVLVLRTDYF